MNREFYIEKMNDHLNDDKTYAHLNTNNDHKVLNKIKKLTKKYHECFTEKETDYLLNFESKTSNMYGLPKIHKSKQINNIIQEAKSSCITTTEPDDLPMRPIIAGPSCPTHRLSNLVDILLKPLTNHVKSYVRDDFDFLNKLPDEVEEDTILITYDVTSLYTNISKETGINAIKYFLEKHPECIPSRFKQEFIIDAIDLILDNNTFQFNGKFYHQKQGTAMGTKMAPSYATLFMGYLEEEFLYKQIDQNFNHEIGQYVRKHWWRYLDDCFILWPQQFGDTHKLTQILQNLNENIKFTINTNKNKIPFLDNFSNQRR